MNHIPSLFWLGPILTRTHRHRGSTNFQYHEATGRGRDSWVSVRNSFYTTILLVDHLPSVNPHFRDLLELTNGDRERPFGFLKFVYKHVQHRLCLLQEKSPNIYGPYFLGDNVLSQSFPLFMNFVLCRKWTSTIKGCINLQKYTIFLTIRIYRCHTHFPLTHCLHTTPEFHSQKNGMKRMFAIYIFAVSL